MSKPSRKVSSRVPASGVEGAFTLWGRANVKGARALAKELLSGPLPDQDRAQLARLLQDTAPDPRALQIAVFAGVVVAVVILLTKILT